jgi:hypothetical protein
VFSPKKLPGISPLLFPHLGDKKPKRRIIAFNSASQIRVMKARKLSDSRRMSTGFFSQSLLPPRGRLFKIYQSPPKSQENFQKKSLPKNAKTPIKLTIPAVYRNFHVDYCLHPVAQIGGECFRGPTKLPAKAIGQSLDL